MGGTGTPLWTGYVDALTAVRALAHEVDLERWGEPTDLPGWSVQDEFSHVTSIESALLGRTDPEHEPEFDKLPHCGDDWVKRHMERGVDLRRGRSPEEVRTELDEVVDARLVEVAALPDDPDALVPGVLGKPRPIGNVVPIRAFDIWAHEQDVRRAVGLDQRLTGPAAEAARDRILMALPDVLSESGVHEGSTVRWVVTGPLDFEAAVHGDRRRRSRGRRGRSRRRHDGHGLADLRPAGLRAGSSRRRYASRSRVTSGSRSAYSPRWRSRPDARRRLAPTALREDGDHRDDDHHPHDEKTGDPYQRQFRVHVPDPTGRSRRSCPRDGDRWVLEDCGDVGEEP